MSDDDDDDDNNDDDIDWVGGGVDTTYVKSSKFKHMSNNDTQHVLKQLTMIRMIPSPTNYGSCTT